MIGKLVESIGEGLRFWRGAWLIYLAQFLLSMIFGLQIYEVLQSSLGHSMVTKELASSFDFTIFQDFINVHGASISPLLGQLRWILLVYWLVGVFIHAGVFYVIYHNLATDFRSIWAGGAILFWRYFVVSIISLLFLAIISALVLGPFFFSISYGMENWKNEGYIVWLGALVIVFYIILLFWLWLFSVRMRVLLLVGDHSLKQAFNVSIRKSLASMKFHLSSILMLLLMLLVIYFFIYYTYDILLPEKVWTVLAVFILVQSLVFAKMLIKVSIFSTLINTMKSNN